MDFVKHCLSYFKEPPVKKYSVLSIGIAAATKSLPIGMLIIITIAFIMAYKRNRVRTAYQKVLNEKIKMEQRLNELVQKNYEYALKREEQKRERERECEREKENTYKRIVKELQLSQTKSEYEHEEYDNSRRSKSQNRSMNRSISKIRFEPRSASVGHLARDLNTPDNSNNSSQTDEVQKLLQDKTNVTRQNFYNGNDDNEPKSVKYRVSKIPRWVGNTKPSDDGVKTPISIAEIAADMKKFVRK